MYKLPKKLLRRQAGKNLKHQWPLKMYNSKLVMSYLRDSSQRMLRGQ